MGTRKVIQITADEGNLYALCDDGTIWFQTTRTGWKIVETKEINAVKT